MMKWPLTLLWLLTWTGFICLTETKTYRTNVLVLGAGWTGISAARRLSELGEKKFIIIEGADAVGGRVREISFGGKTVEVGANWIHGTEGNPFYDMAKKYGLKMVVGYDYEDIKVRAHNGTDLTKAAEAHMKELDAAITKSEEIRSRKLRKNEPDVTYRAALSMSGWLPNNNLMDMVEYSYFDFEYAVPPDQVSLKNGGFQFNYKKFKYEDAFIVDQRGFNHLMRSVMGEFLKEGDQRLHLSKVVKKIEYSKKGVTVTTNNGDVYKAKFAICTFSVGVLEHNVVEFQPPIPYWKHDVINNFDMSYYLKIFVKFPDNTKRFWDKETQIYHVHPRRGYYSFIQNLEAKNLFPEGTNILLVTVTGPEAVRVTRVPKSQVIEELNQVFTSMYGSKAVDIEDVLIPTWINDPLQFGMYSSWPIGVTGVTFDMLRLPIGAVFFAGEHTSKDYYGYLHGAWYEGIRVANDLHRCFRFWTCPNTYRNATNAPYYYKAKGRW